ncbi:MAG: hypothetical protein PF630_10115 [Gammaproteobacteria bacterium]|jgi:hypothetical protein|nr:hypothetical protein [Gammaproteobacteria bacterium]
MCIELLLQLVDFGGDTFRAVTVLFLNPGTEFIDASCGPGYPVNGQFALFSFAAGVELIDSPYYQNLEQLDFALRA